MIVLGRRVRLEQRLVQPASHAVMVPLTTRLDLVTMVPSISSLPVDVMLFRVAFRSLSRAGVLPIEMATLLVYVDTSRPETVFAAVPMDTGLLNVRLRFELNSALDCVIFNAGPLAGLADKRMA